MSDGILFYFSFLKKSYVVNYKVGLKLHAFHLLTTCSVLCIIVMSVRNDDTLYIDIISLICVVSFYCNCVKKITNVLRNATIKTKTSNEQQYWIYQC